MFLKRLVFVHWGNIPTGEFEFGPVNLLSGANGSGKTTAADAIQTIMTAAHENLYHYNPGQEETTQRGRGGKRVRTLASYVLGCDDGSYARTEPTDGYIAAVFHPTPGESAEPFTAMVSVRAWLDQSGKQPIAREDNLVFFLVTAVELELGVLLKDSGNERHVVLLDEVHEVLIKKYGKRAVERYDQKRAYLRRLYAALRGKRDSVTEREAMAAARAFSRFMAYKPVSGIHQFVADEVLDRKDLGEAIRSVSGQLKTIHAMEREAQTLKESAQLLERAEHFTWQYLERWTDLRTFDYIDTRAKFLELQVRYLQACESRDQIDRALNEIDARLQLTAERHAQARSAAIALEAQRQGIPVLQQKDALEAERARLDAEIASAAQELLIQDRRLQENARAARDIRKLAVVQSLILDLPDAISTELERLLQRVSETEAVGDIDISGILQRDLTGDLAMLEQRLDQARAAQRAHVDLFEYWRKSEADDESRRDQVAGLDQRRRLRYEQVSSQCQQKQQDVARLEAKQSVYPSYVERALAAIRAQCPHADARVLCDHVEVTDPRWQAAIEGYLGGARFSILVDSAYEAEAIRIVRGLPGRDNATGVIQGEKALRDASSSKLPADSIVHVLKFSHAVAQAYVIASYGYVARVESEEALRRTARGVTANCMGARSYRMFRCDLPDGELVFGAAARERALKAKRTELDRLTQERQEANERIQESKRLVQAIDSLASLGYADALTDVLELHREARRHELLLAQLDVSAYSSLDTQLEQLRAEESKLIGEQAVLNQSKGELGNKQSDVAKEIVRISEQKDGIQGGMTEAEDALRTLHAEWPQFDLDARLKYADQQAAAWDPGRAQVERSTKDAELRSAERALDTTLQQHNQKCRPVDKVLYQAFGGNYDSVLFLSIRDLSAEIDRVYNLLKNNVLVDKHEQLKQLKQSFNNAFVAHLCQEIHQSLQDGKRQLDQLNKELINHRFGSDRERFRFAQDWVPEYREYARFFEEVMKSPAVGDEATLFEARLSPKSEQVRDALMKLLLGADEQRSLRELERIADYRNYHRYEIYKEVEGKPPIALSEYGTGSGGQLETPAYIIRSASITSALRYAEGTNHLRMVLVDEAFSKMDETRSREVIDYLTQTLGLQLMFIMPTSKCGPFMDLVSNEFVFAKVPSAPRGQLNSRVLVDRKQCNRPRIQELWARHRRTVHQQAEIDFLADVADQDAANSVAELR
jgi:energy-coupling factor transporter ATP-binding protein EcfA2